MKKLLVLCLFVFGPLQVFSSYRGLYVDGFAAILGNAQKEDSLLTYAQANGFSTLSLYDLHIVNQQHNLTQVATSQILADFIHKAKTQYSVTAVTAIGESYSFFNTVISPYNNIHAQANDRFDVYDLEFEFWNGPLVGPSGVYCVDYLIPYGYPCTVAGAYSFYITQLDSINMLAHSDGCTSETYIGWPDSLQAVGMLPYVDHILLHAYVTDPANAFSYTQTRLSYLGSTAATPHVAVIFSSEPSFLGPWLATHPETMAYSIYSNDYNAATGTWKDHLDLDGYQWFDYSDMPYTITPTAVSGGFQMENIKVATVNNTIWIFTEGNTNTALKCKLYDLSGRLLQSFDIAENYPGTYTNLLTFSAGLYILSIDNLNSKQRKTEKLVIFN